VYRLQVQLNKHVSSYTSFIFNKSLPPLLATTQQLPPHHHPHNQHPQYHQQIQLTSRIKSIDIDTQIHRLLRSDPVLDLLDDAISTDLVDLTCLDDLETAVAVVLIVRGAGERRADAGVDVGVVGQEAFLCGVEEIGAVVYAGLFGWGAAEDFGSPCVAGN
jgi:hypothetical protein